jgi:hypothetical protein
MLENRRKQGARLEALEPPTRCLEDSRIAFITNEQ